jgi:hypothetical protein
MSPAPIPKVPARMARIPHVSTLTHLPPNVRLHPLALCAPVPQVLRAGRHAKGVISMHSHQRTRRELQARERARQELLDQIQRKQALVDSFAETEAEARFQIARLWQELQRLESA